MIANGIPHNNGVKLAQYITTGKDGERAELWKLVGFASPDIKQAFRCVHVMAEATKCEHPFFHVQVRNREGERLTREQWEIVAHRVMRINGLTGQPYAIAFHTDELTGEEHMHLAVSLIDAETMTAKRLPFYGLRLKRISRELEKEFGLEPVKNERDTPIKYAAKKDEQRQAQRLGVDKDAIRNTIRACHDRTECGRDFDNELAEEGLILAQGTRRDYVVIDHAGGIHALGKRILDISASHLRDKLADLDRENMPTIEQAREFMLDLPKDRVEKLTRELAEVQKQIEAADEYARRDPVREEMEWLDKVAEAAIAKEEVERQFVEARPAPAAPAREEEARGGRQEREQPQPATAMQPEKQKEPGQQQQQPPKPKRTAPPISKTDGGIRLAYSLTGTGQEFADAIEDRGLIASRVNEADAERLNRWERQRLKELEALAPARAGSWMAQTGGFENLPPELQEKAEASYAKWPGDKQRYGLHNYVDYVQTHEAERREAGQRQKRPYEKYKAGEIVVVDQWSGVHQLNYRNTGARPDERAERLRDIDTAPLMSVADAESVMKSLSAHRQEERRQIWEQKRQEFQRAAQERHWPIMPAQPEHKSAALFNQAATEAARDERTENLTGPAAQAFEAWRQTGSDKARAAELAALYGNKGVSLPSPTKEEFAAMLDDRGISFARASKEEADRSHKQADLARAADNYAPRFREGEIVIVTEARLEFNSEPRRRVYKLDQSIAKKFVTRLDIADRLQSIETTLKASDERQQKRRDEIEAVRTERATDINVNLSARRPMDKAVLDVAFGVAKTGEEILTKGKTAARVIGGAFNIGVELAGLFFSAFDTPKSPRQQARDNLEGERLTDRRNAEAEVKIDFSRYTGERAQEQRNEQQEEAARDRERGR